MPELPSRESASRVLRAARPQSARRGWRRVPTSGSVNVRERRRDLRIATRVRVRTATVDPIHDPQTGTVSYLVSEEDAVLDMSRRGARLRCVRPLAEGTRILLSFELPGCARALELVGRARWTRVEYLPGMVGARALTAVGVEFIGGARDCVDAYQQRIRALQRPSRPLAAADPVG